MVVMVMFHVCHQPEVDLVRIIYILHVYMKLLGTPTEKHNNTLYIGFNMWYIYFIILIFVS